MLLLFKIATRNIRTIPSNAAFCNNSPAPATAGTTSTCFIPHTLRISYFNSDSSILSYFLSRPHSHHLALQRQSTETVFFLSTKMMSGLLTFMCSSHYTGKSYVTLTASFSMLKSGFRTYHFSFAIIYFLHSIHCKIRATLQYELLLNHNHAFTM